MNETAGIASNRILPVEIFESWKSSPRGLLNASSPAVHNNPMQVAFNSSPAVAIMTAKEVERASY